MKKRVVPGFLIAGLWLLLLVMGSPFLFCLVAALLVLLAADEYLRMVDTRNTNFFEHRLLTVFIAAPSLITCFYPKAATLAPATLLAIFITTCYFLYRYQDIEDKFNFFCRLIFGVIYIGLLSAHLVLLRFLPDGGAWLIVGTAITAGSDTGAYFVGKAIGKRKLCPNISPNKTVEGAVGGVLAGLIAGTGFAVLFLTSIHWMFLLVSTVVLALMGIAGDLTESIIKRGTGTKDSGRCLAGHGGILDRVDSLLFVGPALYYLLAYTVYKMKYIALLGATGSIGVNVLAVVRQFPQRYKVVAMAAATNVQRLAEQIIEFQPELVSLYDEQKAGDLAALLPKNCRTRIVVGQEGNILVATFPSAEITVSAMVGAAGLLPTLAAIAAGKDIGLANKETLVMAGRIVLAAARENGVRLLPIDSEHSAIFQALEAGQRKDLKKIILTASGGPFLGMNREQLQMVTHEQALKHPNWIMGRKISIDSASLMNKGLEVIEAKWLFDVDCAAIEVVIHPQSIVHSLVEYQDGSVLAQLGIPDMRIPIAYALSYPDRLPLQLQSLNLTKNTGLRFFEPDNESFPALQLAFSAIRKGGVLPAVLNAANEVAVEAFLAAKIKFPQIVKTVARTMNIVDEGSDTSLSDILEADKEARRVADGLVQETLS